MSNSLSDVLADLVHKHTLLVFLEALQEALEGIADDVGDVDDPDGYFWDKSAKSVAKFKEVIVKIEARAVKMEEKLESE